MPADIKSRSTFHSVKDKSECSDTEFQTDEETDSHLSDYVVML